MLRMQMLDPVWRIGQHGCGEQAINRRAVVRVTPRHAVTRQIARGLTAAASRSRAVERVVQAVDRRTRHTRWILPVLMYHRVDADRPQADLDPILRSAAPEAFEEQVRLLAAEYHPLSLDDLLAVRAGQHELPERAVLLTFDDGYRDFAVHAWPVLQRHQVPATLFVPTAYPDDPTREFWWDRLYRAFMRTSRTAALTTRVGTFSLESAAARYESCRTLAEQLKGLPDDDAMRIVEYAVGALGAHPAAPAVLGWDDLRSLVREGLTVAPHSRTHAMLDQVPRERLEYEVMGSRHDIEDAIGRCPPVFCYPAGRRSALVEQVLHDAGCLVAFTTELGHNDLRSAEWLGLRRINVSPRVTRTVLRALLNPLAARLLRRLG
jgi:peptidoglycan/xylan/chitin deacetylase (PgdA/CDA1 family)